ncbi:helix-turn-helix domain-containing protein [Arthrobacter deserti]|uniref:Helix-turn-helix domain-containing protein n=1 Tax=Arthrobacter deserti TaxID=1742687 RepID=A0ABX1JRE5_9MICC|nr:helix-turn-helix domain-containing protein [Arthrobacter deserti]
MASGTLKVSTLGGAGIFEANTFEEWQERMSNRFVRLQVSTSRPDNFHALLHGRSFDDISLSRTEPHAHQVDRLQDFICQGEARYYKLSMLLGGAGLVVQDGREAVLGPGDMVIYVTARPYSAVFVDAADSLVMVFPQVALSVSAESVARLTATALSSTSGMGRLVGPFLRELAATLDSISGHGGIMLAHNTLVLVNTMAYTELGAQGADPRTGALAEVKEYIDRNLASSTLGPSTIAAAHYMSTPRLHYLFEGAGTTVPSWIKARRLDRSRRDLMDPALGHATITQIATRWGFPDSAHFSRAFKAPFGATPSEYRRPR